MTTATAIDSFDGPVYWSASQQDSPRRCVPLEGHQQADVVIVGGGFTGLWTAWYLKQLAPHQDIRVLEAEHFGHGASGRNGGWVIGNIAGLERHLEGLDIGTRQDLCRLLGDNVDDLGNALAEAGIDADFHKGGALNVAARYPAQEAIQRRYLAHLHELGFSEQHCQWLSADELTDMARFRRPFGAAFQHQVATLHPRKLINGLVRQLAATGVHLHEQSRVISTAERQVSTHEGSVEARTVVIATEGYSEKLANIRRHVIPVESLVIATEALSDAMWDAVGLASRPTFADASRLINYGHRTRDGRLVFGARGNYRLGARSRHSASINDGDIAMRQRLLVDLFPALEGVEISHGWGGSLGLSRSFRPHVVLASEQGLATAGGYAGEGVAASHLMGRTLAETILGEDSLRTRAPWVFQGRSLEEVVRRWEPEPLRWLAAQTILTSYAAEEALMREERRLPLISPGLGWLNNAFASVIE